MNLIQESYQRLFPDKDFSYQEEMEYNRRLGDFNANISLHKDTIKVNLNLQWKDIDEEIKIGLIQHLLLKIFKNNKIKNSKKNTANIELYNNFVRNIPLLTPKTKTDRALEESFNRVNGRFFSSEMEKPNLAWGTESRRKLAGYNFHNDTITISTVFKDAANEVLDYLMYHELLHKHHKFRHKNGRSSFHTREFRRDEKLFQNHNIMEENISRIIAKRKDKGILDFIRNFGNGKEKYTLSKKPIPSQKTKLYFIYNKKVFIMHK